MEGDGHKIMESKYKNINSQENNGSGSELNQATNKTEKIAERRIEPEQTEPIPIIRGPPSPNRRQMLISLKDSSRTWQTDEKDFDNMNTTQIRVAYDKSITPRAE